MRREEADALHRRICEMFASEDFRLTLTPRELAGLRNALSESLRELGIEEFHTRVGVGFDEGHHFLREIEVALRT